MSKKRRVLIGVVGAAVIVGLAVLFIYLNNVRIYKEKVANTYISDIDIREIPDGTYTGDYDVGLICAEVEVTVRDGNITGINLLKHENGRGSAAESIISDIINKQSLDVDAVSGATNSSKVIRKAVENALLKANQAE
jgi:uncharacterized protein with FMN-binding domain